MSSESALTGASAGVFAFAAAEHGYALPGLADLDRGVGGTDGWQLHWRDDGWRDGGTRRLSGHLSGCLERFWALARAPEAAVLAFANEFGPLGICGRHHVFAGHDGDCAREVDASVQIGHHREPVAMWRYYADLVGALLRGAATLLRGQALDERDWSSIVFWLDQPRLERGGFGLPSPSEALVRAYGDPQGGTPARLAMERSLIGLAASQWLREASVAPTMRWDGGRSAPEPALAFNGLAGLLGVQLVTVLTSPTGLWRCSRCGTPYTPPHRRPRAGFPNYCPECADEVRKANQRDYWRRRHQGGG